MMRQLKSTQAERTQSLKPLTKQTIPTAPKELMERPRLHLRFKSALSHKVILVAAAAGYGKTIFLSEVLTTVNHRPTVWLSLDKRDNDFTYFWINLIMALQKIYPGLADDSLDMLHTGNGTIESALITLGNEISENMADLIIVLDNYQEIDNQIVHDSLNFLLEYVSSPVCIIISSRTIPPLPLAQLRAYGHLTEIEAADLQFTREETYAFLNSVSEFSFSEEDIDLIQDSIEGWIAGLQMMALSLQEHQDTRDLVSILKVTNKNIIEYLTKEVLDQQEEYIRKFLLETSILNNFNESLCNTITGRDDSQRILERMVNNNLFIQPADKEGNWFRYHPLFKNLLYKHLKKTQPEIIPTLHSSASKWFKNQGFIEEAIEHALAAEEIPQAADLLQNGVLDLLCRDENILIIEEWLGKIPDQFIAQKIQVCFAGALNAFVKRHIEDVERYRNFIETIINSNNHEYPIKYTDKTYSMVKIICAMDDYYQGNVENAFVLAQEAINSLPQEEATVRYIICAILGVINWARGDLQTSYRYYKDSVCFSKKVGGNYAALIAAMAHIQFARVHLKSAEDMCLEAIQLFGVNSHTEETGVSYASLLLGQILYQKNNLDDAVSCINRSIYIGQFYKKPAMCINGYLAMANLNLVRGNLDEGVINIRQARIITYEVEGRYSFLADMAVTNFLLKQGKIREAIEHFTNWIDLQDTNIVESISNQLYLYDVRDIWYESPYVTLLRIYFAQNENDKIQLLFEDIYQHLVERESIFHVIECLILKALVYQNQNKIEEALDVLKKVFSLTEKEEYIRVFIDEGQPMLELLKVAKTRRVFPTYVRKLIKSFQFSAKQSQFMEDDFIKNISHSSSSSNRSGNPIELLSNREQEILNLIKEGLSNKEIASRLTITVATVKSHLFNIYQKLGVYNRKSAIIKAQEIGLP
jgi:LuxR family transcriptional regulator, maltose regulon positive regulatory protein